LVVQWSWVTGASSGIGRVTRLAFAERGVRVVLATRRAVALEELAGGRLNTVARIVTPSGRI
jgi:NADP-dependent 3-hydroxy acid dehydrogenase YdfG